MRYLWFGALVWMNVYCAMLNLSQEHYLLASANVLFAVLCAQELPRLAR